MREPAIISLECGGHTFMWIFREDEAHLLPDLIAGQFLSKREEFSKLSDIGAWAAMYEARMCQKQYLEKGAMR